MAVNAPLGHTVGKGWPSWRYHPETGVGAIFQRSLDVPPGWVDDPKKSALYRAKQELIPKTTQIILPAGVEIPKPKAAPRRMQPAPKPADVFAEPPEASEA